MSGVQRPALVAPSPPDGTIAFWLPSLQDGGAQRVFLTVAGLLHERGYDTEVVVGEGRGPMRDEVPEGVPLIDLERHRLQRALPDLMRYLSRTKPRCLISTIEHANVLAVAAVRLGRHRTPIAVRTANTISLLSRKTNKPTDRVHYFMTKPLYPLADVILAPSQGAATDLERYVGVESGRVRVLPNPVVGPDLLAAARQPVDHPFFDTPDRPVVLSVGRLVEQKDHATLLDAFARTRRHHDARLMILGDGPLRPMLLARAQELGLQPGVDVDFPGFDPNPFRFMAAARLFVLSSHFEGLPGVLIQALACGTEVVSTDCPSGPREILADGAHGRLVPVRDAGALGEAMAAALAGPARPPAPTSWSRFSHESAIGNYVTLIDDLCGTADRRSPAVPSAPAAPVSARGLPAHSRPTDRGLRVRRWDRLTSYLVVRSGHREVG